MNDGQWVLSHLVKSSMFGDLETPVTDLVPVRVPELNSESGDGMYVYLVETKESGFFLTTI